MNSYQDRPALAEISKRTGEAGAGLAAASHALALGQAAERMEAAMNRVADSHALRQAVLRGGDLAALPPVAKEAGVRDIIVTGDLYGDRAVDVLKTQGVEPKSQPPSTAPVVTPPAQSSSPDAGTAPASSVPISERSTTPWWKSPAALVLAGALLGGGAGAGIPAAVSALTASPPKVQAGTAPGSHPDQWMEYRIEKIPADQLPPVTEAPP